MKLVIVDRDSSHLAELEEKLKHWEYDITTTSDSLEAWEILQNDPEPVMVLLDWQSPMMNGESFCTTLKTKRPNRLCHVIMIADCGDKEQIATGLAAGADAWVSRPIHPQELKSALALGKRVLEYQYMIEKLNEESLQEKCKLETLTGVDALTGVANRKLFEERYLEEWRRAERDGLLLSLVLLDIDDFRQYNETYGYMTGDECLKKVAEAIEATAIRAGDLVARYAADEFAILLPNTDAVGATVVAESLGAAILHLNIEHRQSPRQIVSVSIGHATVWPHKEANGAQSLLDKSTHMLTLTKAANRTRNRELKVNKK